MSIIFESIESRLMLSAAPVAAVVDGSTLPAIVVSARPAVSRQRAEIDKLLADLASIKSHSGVTSAQINALKSDLKQIAAVATKPSSASVTKLYRDVKAAIKAGAGLTVAVKLELAGDVTTVLESANVPTELAAQTVSDLGAIISAGNVTLGDVKLIAGDLEALADTFIASH